MRHRTVWPGAVVLATVWQCCPTGWGHGEFTTHPSVGLVASLPWGHLNTFPKPCHVAWLLTWLLEFLWSSTAFEIFTLNSVSCLKSWKICILPASLVFLVPAFDPCITYPCRSATERLVSQNSWAWEGVHPLHLFLSSAHLIWFPFLALRAMVRPEPHTLWWSPLSWTTVHPTLENISIGKLVSLIDNLQLHPSLSLSQFLQTSQLQLSESWERFLYLLKSHILLGQDTVLELFCSRPLTLSESNCPISKIGMVPAPFSLGNGEDKR